ncbi:MAG: C39 family peptidase [Anaerolineales bacterium]|nr:C39 family peptidase [Anaerolineales bacterium]
MQRFKNINKLWFIPVAILLAIGVYFLPPVHDRFATRVDLLRTRIVYFFNPPNDAVFQPSGETALTIETVIATTRAEYSLTLTSQAITPPLGTPTPKAGPTLTPTVTSTPLPDSVILPGVIYVDQHNRWNYCGPANLTMALNFWGWKGTRDDVAKVVKPGSGDPKKNFIEQGLPDKNVMPYELVDFVNINTEYRALSRYGGDMELIKRLIAAGYPVVVEKGYYERDYNGKIDWLGHYLFTTGYDDARGGFIVQDAYLKPGKDLLSTYDDYLDGWRSFNYLFMVVYPAGREAEVMKILGPWADDKWASQHALELAQNDIQSLTGNDLFFAWFNKGTSHVALQQYVDAANAYDQAFTVYAGWNVKVGNRPFRMMWYQTGPYFSYYYSARYQDVINLANTTLNDTISTPTLEESLLWRGRAYYMIGNTKAAVDDYRAALKVHVNWFPAVQALQELGLQP